MKSFRLLCLLSLLTLPSHAAVYEWVDDKGVASFTDNVDNIPSKYRSRARVKDLAKQKNVTIIRESTPSSATSGTSPGGGTSGEHDERWWRERISAVREELINLQQGLPEKRKQLQVLQHKRTVFHKSSDRIAYNTLQKEIEGDEARVAELTETVKRLEAEAAASAAR